MKISTSNTLITLLIVLLSMINISTMFLAQHSYQRRHQALENNQQFLMANTELAKGSDILTNAVHAYVTTGDESYHRLFQKERGPTGHRDLALKRLSHIDVGKEALALMKQAKYESDMLTQLEDKAFEAMAKGKRAKAIAFVYGPEYAKKKASILALLDKADKEANLYQTAKIKYFSNTADQHQRIAIIAMLMNILIIFWALFGFYRRKVILPLTGITQQIQDIIEGKKNIFFNSGKNLAEITALNQTLNSYQQLLIKLDEQKEQLFLANEQMQAIFDAANIGVVVICNQWIISCNKSMDEMLGYTYGEQIGQLTHIWQLDEQNLKLLDEKAYKTDHRDIIKLSEQTLVRKDGNRIWVRATGKIIPLKDSIGIVAFFEDITIERAAIEEIIKAKALAEEATQMKSDFLANMSHEIRTPMNAIIGFTHLLLKAEPNPQQEDYLKKIQNASQHLLGVINEILDFSKIESGKFIIEHTPFALNEVLDNVANLMSSKCAAKGLELLIRIDENVSNNLIGDPLRISQLLINYANNAIKFTQKGEIEIHISQTARTTAKILLHCSVRDTGIGLSQEDMSRLFKSFEQADQSTTRKYGGTGLGLAINKRLAELMGGNVGVESQVGLGSTFWFTVEVEEDETKPQTLIPQPDLRGRHILVVDDNAYAREIITSMLSNMTFVVNAVASGREALDEIKRRSVEKPYEIILLDWKMPELDGIDTAKAILAMHLKPEPKLALFTSFDRMEALKAAESLGIKEVLTKPITSSQLFDAIMHLFGITGRQNHKKTISIKQLSADNIGAEILVVEDNELNQEVARELLKQAGFKVDIAENGAVALQKIQEKNYDIVLMDMQMPVMDGIHATQEIRKMPQYDDLPIIAMTASAMESDKKACLAAGMNAHLAKPIDPERLWSTLEQWIKPNKKDKTKQIKPQVIDAPPMSAIDGLDMTKGLQLALGQEKLYFSLLTKFVEGQINFDQSLNLAINAQNWPSAIRLAHTLKGSAAQICANKLHILAEKLELALTEKDTETYTILAIEIKPLLNTLIQSIQQQLPHKAESNSTALDTSALNEICKQLMTLLEQFDFMSTSYLEEHEALLKLGLGEDYDKIAKLIHDFDFTNAALQLKNAAKTTL